MRLRAVFLLAIGVLLGRGAFGSTQLITNGGFEAVSSAPWVAAQDLTSVPVVVNPAQAHSGNNFVELGNANGTFHQAIFQTIDIPTNTLVARFSYFWSSTNGLDPAGADQFESVIQVGANGSTIDLQSSANTGYQF